MAVEYVSDARSNDSRYIPGANFVSNEHSEGYNIRRKRLRDVFRENSEGIVLFVQNNYNEIQMNVSWFDNENSGLSVCPLFSISAESFSSPG